MTRGAYYAPVCAIFILASSNILDTIKPSSLSRQRWYRRCPTNVEADFHSSSSGVHLLIMPSFISSPWTARRSFSASSCACLRFVSTVLVLSIWSGEVVGVRILQARSVATTSRLVAPNVITYHKDVRRKTYSLAPRLTSFCQYSMTRVSCSGSRWRFRR